jgi:hypothetical protein
MFDFGQLEIQSEIQELKELGLDSEEIDGYICFFWDFPIESEEGHGIN